MTEHTAEPRLTPALEDYLETIYRLIGKSGVARVGDIAKERQVKPGSVTPAMKRLDQMGLIDYHQRENVGLTAAGEKAARKIYARHRVLRRFFTSILNLPPEIAEQDACAAEHSLSPQAVDQMVRFFEYMEICPEGQESVDRFLSCSAVHPGIAPCPHQCDAEPLHLSAETRRASIADLEPGQRARVQQVDCQGAVRRRLLDMGLLPGTEVSVARVAPAGDPVWIQLQGYELALRMNEARAVTVEVRV